MPYFQRIFQFRLLFSPGSPPPLPLLPSVPSPRHSPYPSAQPARAGVRSESLHPAERTDKKTAGSHGTGSFDDHPPLLRQQVSARAPVTQRERPRTHTLAPSSPHHLSPYIHHFPNPSCAAHIGARTPRSAPLARFCPSPCSGGSSPPHTTRPLGAPLPPQLLAVRRPLHALHPRRSRRRPRMASSWRIWPARILLLWLRRPRCHRRHSATVTTPP